MSYNIVFYDDARARAFEPFALSRPMCEMRVGALLMRERWEHALRGKTIAFAGAPRLSHFSEGDAPRFMRGRIAKGTVLVNSRAAVALSHAAFAFMRKDDAKSAPEFRSWYVNETLAAIQLRGDLEATVLADGAATLEQIAAMDLAGEASTPNPSQREVSAHAAADARVNVSGFWINEVWDIVRHLTPMLTEDIPVVAQSLKCGIGRARDASDGHTPAMFITGKHEVFIEQGATVEPYVVFDTASGPILVRAGASVQAFTRVVGPCYIGQHSTVMGDRISGSSIGDTCRVHGELSATVFIGHANKGHDGFVGHSIVGRWVNMGAGTITSNLKNTYGTVALWTPDGVRNTGLQFLGTLFGDHAKTGIGVKLTTGCVLGTGANVFDRMPPKAVEPFAWGSGVPYDSYSIDKFVETAARMMARRSVTLDADGQQHLRDVHDARWRVT